jgi:hypothetical protein
VELNLFGSFEQDAKEDLQELGEIYRPANANILEE